MLRQIFLLLTLSWFALSQGCTPFGVRLQYGQSLASPDSTQKVAISFNTHFSCSSSFLRLLTNQGFKQISCEQQQIVASEKMNNFTTFVQRCFINGEINFGETFSYNVFGWTGGSEDPIDGLDAWVNTKIIDPVKFDGSINILLLADWGVIKTTGFVPIGESLRSLMIQEDFHLMIVLGDIAYDLDSNKGANYIEFLNMGEQFFSQIPCIFIPGNHQNYSDDDKILLNSTFQLYNLSQNLATGFQFGDTYILPFDPYNVAYGKPEEKSSLQALEAQLAIAKSTGLFTIPMSHYPVTCSGESSVCQAVLAELHVFFDTMIKYGASFYAGAHAHVYERIYPYFANQGFQKIESPYRDDQGYLVSVVEGVAGSDTDMVLQMPIVYDYTASYTVNETGFGILTINSNNEILFSQYSTKRGFVDSMIIQKNSKKQVQVRPQQKTSNLRLQFSEE